jgi:iron complex outermembrane receptor protein
VGGVYNFDGIDDVRSFDFAQNPITAPPPVNFVTRSYHQGTMAWAGYAQGSYDFDEHFRLHAAVRYTNEHKEMTNASVYIPSLGFYLFKGVNESLSLHNHWSGEVGLDYKIDDEKMLYVKMTHGYKSGGMFGGFSASSNNLLPYLEETNTAYELGAKTLWWQELQLNGAAYFYDYGNKQGYINQLNPPPFTGTSVRLGNIGDENLYGVELEALWGPSAVPGFTVSFNPAWYKGEVVSTSATAVSVSGAPISLVGPIDPQWSYTATGRYEHPVFDGMLGSVSLNYYRHGFGNGGSTAITDPVSNAIYHIRDYGQLDGRIALSPEDSKWEVAFEVQNLTDASFDTVVTRDSGGSYMGLYNQPRNWRIQIHYAF